MAWICLAGNMPKHTPAEKAAKQKLANVKAKVRLLLLEDDIQGAEDFAKKSGISILDARLAPEYKNAAEPIFAALEARYKSESDASKAYAMAPVSVESSSAPVVCPSETFDAPEPTEEFVNGWPKETAAVIWGFCPNKLLVIIELPDKRKASMWKGRGNTWKIYDRCRATLERCEADPIYAPKPRQRF